MLKIITWLINKMEVRLSKKEKCFFKNKTSNEKLILYRNLLDKIDEYNYKIKGVRVARHYRYITLKIEDLESKGE